MPDLPGMDCFPGRQLHSHNFRTPTAFAGQTVMVVGASFSGMPFHLAAARSTGNITWDHHLRHTLPVGETARGCATPQCTAAGDEVARRIATEAAAVYHSARSWEAKARPGSSQQEPGGQQQQQQGAHSEPLGALPCAKLLRRPMVQRLEADGRAVFEVSYR